MIDLLVVDWPLWRARSSPARRTLRPPWQAIKGAVLVSIEASPSLRHRVSVEPDWYEPYAISLGIRIGNLVFVSGQGAVDEHGANVGGSDFEAQGRQVFANLARVLDEAGSGLEHVVKVTIFVTDMAMIDQVIALRREFFTRPFPADTIAHVSALASPEWQIEIEAVAVVPGPIGAG